MFRSKDNIFHSKFPDFIRSS